MTQRPYVSVAARAEKASRAKRHQAPRTVGVGFALATTPRGLQRGMVSLATVVRMTRAPSLDEDGSMLKARCTDEHQALQHAERKVRTYSKAVLGLAGLCSCSHSAATSHPPP